MPGQLRKRLRLRVFNQRLFLLGTLLLLLLWSGTFFSLRQEKSGAEDAANQVMLMIIRGAATRANDVFHDAYEYVYLSQVAERMGMPFGVLYEAMAVEKDKVDAVDYVLQFNNGDQLLYSSVPLTVLPQELRGLAPGDRLQYVTGRSMLDREKTIFYIVGANPSGGHIAVAIDSDAFVDYVRPVVHPERLQLSLGDLNGRLFSQQNIEAEQLASLVAVRHVNDDVLWERMSDGQLMVAGKVDLASAPFALRLALPETILLQNYYNHWEQIVATSVAVSGLLIVSLFFIGRIVSVRVEATRQLEEEKERFQQLVENLHEVFFVREADSTRILYISPSVQKLWAGFDGSLDGVWENFFTRIYPEDQDKLKVMKQNLSQPDGTAELEYRMRGVNGDIRWVWGRATRLTRAPEPDWVVGVIEDITDRKRLEQALSKMAKTDPLTSLANRAQFFEHGELERYRANRYGHSLTVLMIDIDYFKQVNDTYGHSVGDQVLVMVTRHCSQLLRPTDMMARIGGEEFAVVLSETNLEQACALAERLRVETAQQQVLFEGQNVFVTISIGVAQLRPDDSTFDAVLRRADDALYQAKREGRNRVATIAE